MPIDFVAEATLATLRGLVASSGGSFTDATIPPRLVGKLYSDVVRIRHELENRRHEAYASGSTAGKRRAIEHWYEEQLRR